MNKKTIIWAVVAIAAIGLVYWFYNMKKAADLKKAEESAGAGTKSYTLEEEGLIGVELGKGYNREEAIQLLISRGLLTAVNS